MNIVMKRYYHNLKEAFGYEFGVYGDFEHSINISLFAKTIFYLGNDEYRELNILSVIAPAFDAPEQSDFRYFGSDDEKSISRFELIFDMIFNCAVSHHFSNIFLTGFGVGFFPTNIQITRMVS